MGFGKLNYRQGNRQLGNFVTVYSYVCIELIYCTHDVYKLKQKDKYFILNVNENLVFNQM